MSVRDKSKAILIGLGKFFSGLSFRQYLVLLFLLAFAFRLLIILFLSNFERVYGMENEVIAFNLLSGKGYSYNFIENEMPSALVGPVYTFFLYFHFLLFGKNYFYVELSQALIGAISAILTALIARRLMNHMAGIISGLLFAIYPIYAYWCALPHQLILDIFLVELSIYLALVALEKKKFGYHLLAGLMMGLSALSKSFYLSFVPIYIIWFWLWQKPKIKTLIYLIGIWFLGIILIISPWAIRNYRVFGEWVPLTTNGGANFWYGNNPFASGALYTENGKPMLSMIPEDLIRKIRLAKTEAEKDQLLYEAGLSWVKQNPVKFIKLIPYRLRAIWWFDPEMGSNFPQLRKMVYIFLLLFSLPGVWLTKKVWRKFSVFYLLLLWTSIFYSFSVGQARFRYLLEFWLLIFSGIFLSRLLEKIRE